MVRKIKLINFESHVNTEMNFQQGMTIISGNSSQGKSGIFRALRFVILNLSEGEDSINYNANECSVEITYNDDVIKRVRSRKGKNEYYLNGVLYKAFGQSVPEDIQKVFNLNPINFEWQFDKRPFLLAETGGYIASKLNEIVNLELIDQSLKSIESERRTSKKEKEIIKEQIDNIEPKIEKFKWLEKAEEILKSITELEDSIEKNNKTIENMSNLAEEYKYLYFLYDKLAIINADKLDEISKSINNFNRLNNTFTSLNLLSDNYKYNISEYNAINIIDNIPLLDIKIDAYEKNKKTYSNMKKIYNDMIDINYQLKNIGNIIRNRKIKRINEAIQNYDISVKNLLKLEQIKNLYKHVTVEIKLVANDILLLKNEYRAIAPDICPLCGGPMKKELI